MRGDATLQLRLLLQPHGMLGTTIVVAGAAALAAAYLPWYEAVAQVHMLEVRQSRGIIGLAGWEAHPWGWLVPACSIVVIIIGALIAADRAPTSVVPATLTAGAALAAMALAALPTTPPLSRFAGVRLGELTDLAARLPRDVELDLIVRPTAGIWLLLTAAVLVTAAGALVHRLR